jgi:hypothetical protein
MQRQRGVCRARTEGSRRGWRYWYVARLSPSLCRPIPFGPLAALCVASLFSDRWQHQQFTQMMDLLHAAHPLAGRKPMTVIGAVKKSKMVRSSEGRSGKGGRREVSTLLSQTVSPLSRKTTSMHACLRCEPRGLLARLLAAVTPDW